jgi:peptide/nickel transport system permease protein
MATTVISSPRVSGSAISTGSSRRYLLRRLLADVPALLSLVVIATVVLIALLAPWLAPFDPALQNLSAQGVRPFDFSAGPPAHLLGTDHLGRDVLSRVLTASRISLAVGLTATVISGTIGVTLSLIAGYYRGWLDEALMRLADVQLAIPYLLFGLTLLIVIGPSVGSLIAILALHSWVVYARVVRSQVLTLREGDFVLAARAVGAGSARILARHILPNVWASIIVVATLEIAAVIVLEGTLSFLGVGIQAPAVSWGLMLNEGRDYLARYWWVTAFPGLALSVTVLSINLFGDWLRDVLDPRLRS